MQAGAQASPSRDGWMGPVGDPDHFTTRLPAKRIAADCLIRDQHGLVLLVRPSYKTGWDLPGGVVETDESPQMAASREVHEELGINITPSRLLVVDWIARRGDFTEVVALLFDGGILGSDRAAQVHVDGQEIVEAAFHDPCTLTGLLDEETARRALAGLAAIESRATAYLEDGLEVV